MVRLLLLGVLRRHRRHHALVLPVLHVVKLLVVEVVEGEVATSATPTAARVGRRAGGEDGAVPLARAERQDRAHVLVLFARRLLAGPALQLRVLRLLRLRLQVLPLALQALGRVHLLLRLGLRLCALTSGLL